MNPESTKSSQNKAGCAEFDNMSGMYKDMMERMEKCCPGMKKNISNKESIQAMMKNCCGAMVSQAETSKSSHSESRQQTDKKSSHKFSS